VQCGGGGRRVKKANIHRRSREKNVRRISTTTGGGVDNVNVCSLYQRRMIFDVPRVTPKKKRIDEKFKFKAKMQQKK